MLGIAEELDSEQDGTLPSLGNIPKRNLRGRREES